MPVSGKQRHQPNADDTGRTRDEDPHGTKPKQTAAGSGPGQGKSNGNAAL
jgi:hypothetical protein